MLKTALIIQGCWTAVAEQGLHRAKDISAPHMTSKEAESAQGEWTQQGQLTQLTTETLQTIWHYGEEGGDIQNDGACLPTSPLHTMEPCFRGDTCPWEVGNEYLVLLGLHGFCFPY